MPKQTDNKRTLELPDLDWPKRRVGRPRVHNSKAEAQAAASRAYRARRKTERNAKIGLRRPLNEMLNRNPQARKRRGLISITGFTWADDAAAMRRIVNMLCEESARGLKLRHATMHLVNELDIADVFFGPITDPVPGDVFEFEGLYGERSGVTIIEHSHGEQLIVQLSRCFGTPPTLVFQDLATRIVRYRYSLLDPSKIEWIDMTPSSCTLSGNIRRRRVIMEWNHMRKSYGKPTWTTIET